MLRASPEGLREQHADVPAAVRRKPAPARCACGGRTGPGGECASCRAKRLARPRAAAPAGGGRPLPHAERAFFEPRLGHDLGGIRVHTGGPAAASARALSARAYALCPDGNWNVDAATGVVDSPDRATFCGARPAVPHLHHTTSRHPTSCGCLCELTAPVSNTIEVQIDENLTVGGNVTPVGPLGQAATSHVGATDKVTAVSGREPPTVTGAGATTPVSGAGRTQQLSTPVWAVFGHEVCGHARLQSGPMSPTAVEHASTPGGDATTVDVENRIRREHSTVAASLGIRGGSFGARDAAGLLVSRAGAVYRIGTGETLSGVAVRCGISVVDVLDHMWRFNGTASPRRPSTRSPPASSCWSRASTGTRSSPGRA